MLKLVAITLVLTVVHAADVTKCITSPESGDDAPASATCDPAGDKCKGPIFVEGAGITDTTYGCGACPDSSEATCKECDSNDCNTYMEKGTEYTCKKYTWDAETTAYKEGTEAEAVKCPSLKSNTDRKCNKPGAEAKTDGSAKMQAGGCGKCVEADVTSKMCEEYNSAMGVSAMFLPLLAALYTLF